MSHITLTITGSESNRAPREPRLSSDLDQERNEGVGNGSQKGDMGRQTREQRNADAQDSKGELHDLFSQDSASKDWRNSASSGNTRKQNPLASHPELLQKLKLSDMEIKEPEWSTNAEESQLEQEARQKEFSERRVWLPEELRDDEDEPSTSYEIPLEAMAGIPTVEQIQRHFIEMAGPEMQKKEAKLEAPEWMIDKIQLHDVKKGEVVRTDVNLPIENASSWDYFYPPPAPPTSLKTSISNNSKDPHARPPPQKIPIKWPFLYNRDELVSKCVNYIMRHGRKASAEKTLQAIFMKIMELRPDRHPVTLLAEAIDLNAPYTRLKTYKRSMKITLSPVALFEKQRIRKGFSVLEKAAAKKDEPFITAFAKEVVKSMEGRGPGVVSRYEEHRKAMVQKLHIKMGERKRIL